MGKDRKPGQPLDLGALNLGIPVSTLDQPHHDLAIKGLGQRMQPVKNASGTFAIGLHDHAKSVPASKIGVAQDRLDHVKRQIKAIGLFRVNIEPHPGFAGLTRQLAGRPDKLAHHAFFLADLIPWMQRRQLDRDAGVFADVLGFALACQFSDGFAVGVKILAGVIRRQGRFAKHVIGKGKPALRQFAAALHRFFDVATKDELVAHFANGTVDSGADHRLPQASDRAMQGRGDAVATVVLQDLSRQHQSPGGGIDQRRTGMPQMRAPGGWRDLVFNQRVHRVSVRHPQQRFGQAHQGDALVG